MIRTEQEYRKALRRLEEDQAVLAEMRGRLEENGLEPEEIQRVLDPSLSFHAQLAEEVEAFERIKRGEFNPLFNLGQLGRLLIGLRIALGMSQRELADRLGVSPAAVSRDERNEYHGISIERAQKIFDAFGIRIRVELDEFG